MLRQDGLRVVQVDQPDNVVGQSAAGQVDLSFWEEDQVVFTLLTVVSPD